MKFTQASHLVLPTIALTALANAQQTFVKGSAMSHAGDKVVFSRTFVPRSSSAPSPAPSAENIDCNMRAQQGLALCKADYLACIKTTQAPSDSASDDLPTDRFNPQRQCDIDQTYCQHQVALEEIECTWNETPWPPENPGQPGGGSQPSRPSPTDPSSDPSNDPSNDVPPTNHNNSEYTGGSSSDYSTGDMILIPGVTMLTVSCVGLMAVVTRDRLGRGNQNTERRPPESRHQNAVNEKPVRWEALKPVQSLIEASAALKTEEGCIICHEDFRSMRTATVIVDTTRESSGDEETGHIEHYLPNVYHADCIQPWLDRSITRDNLNRLVGHDPTTRKPFTREDLRRLDIDVRPEAELHSPISEARTNSGARATENSIEMTQLG